MSLQHNTSPGLGSVAAGRAQCTGFLCNSILLFQLTQTLCLRPYPAARGLFTNLNTFHMNTINCREGRSLWRKKSLKQVPLLSDLPRSKGPQIRPEDLHLHSHIDKEGKWVTSTLACYRLNICSTSLKGLSAELKMKKEHNKRWYEETSLLQYAQKHLVCQSVPVVSRDYLPLKKPGNGGFRSH